jgi:adenylate cyclase
MATEIERKFLVERGWPKPKRGLETRQGYLVAEKGLTVRVRTMGKKAYLTVKAAAKGIARREFEYEVPRADALALLKLCGRAPVEKTRYLVRHRGRTWEVDVFAGANAGLVVAELELGSETERFPRPEWLGKEVTRDRRYLNASLYERPYRSWR